MQGLRSCGVHGRPPRQLGAAQRAPHAPALWVLLQDDHTSLCLEHCLLHVGISLMAGRLDMTDCQIKCTGDSLWTHPDTTLVMRRQAGVALPAQRRLAGGGGPGLRLFFSRPKHADAGAQRGCCSRPAGCRLARAAGMFAPSSAPQVLLCRRCGPGDGAEQHGGHPGLLHVGLRAWPAAGVLRGAAPGGAGRAHQRGAPAAHGGGQRGAAGGRHRGGAGAGCREAARLGEQPEPGTRKLACNASGAGSRAESAC